MDLLIVGAVLGCACLIGYVSGRLGSYMGVRGVRQRLGQAEQELEMLSSRFTKLANQRKSDLSSEARVSGKENELVKVLSQALASRNTGTSYGDVPPAYPPSIVSG
jgi:hypothetical protein